MAGLEVEPKRLDWQPIFSLSAKDFFEYLIKSKFNDPENPDILVQKVDPPYLEKASALLARSTLSSDENFDPKTVADEPVCQAMTHLLITHRARTIRDEAVRLGICQPSTLEQEYKSPTCEELYSYMEDPRFGHALEFTLIQERREEFLQKYTAEMGLYLAYKQFDELDKYRDVFHAWAFPSVDSIETLIANNSEYLDNTELIEKIRGSLYATESGTTDDAKDTLNLFLYVKNLFPDSEQTVTADNLAISLICLHRLISDTSQMEQLGIALKRIGIPLDPDNFGQEEITVENLMRLAAYIGKYFYGMNSVHER